jgi:hypothetical protein
VDVSPPGAEAEEDSQNFPTRTLRNPGQREGKKILCSEKTDTAGGVIFSGKLGAGANREVALRFPSSTLALPGAFELLELKGETWCRWWGGGRRHTEARRPFSQENWG